MRSELNACYLFPLHGFSDLATYGIETVYLLWPSEDILVHPSHHGNHFPMNFLYMRKFQHQFGKSGSCEKCGIPILASGHDFQLTAQGSA